MNEDLFEYNGKKYKAIPVEETYLGCMECCFFSLDEKCAVFPRCTSKYKKEGRDVIFEEIEEEKMEKRMFEDIQKDDKVFYYKKGYCKVTNVDYDSFLIEISEDTELKFNKNGKVCDSDMFPSVFWEKPKMEYPMEKPFNLENEMRKLEIVDFIIEGNNHFLVYNVNLERVDRICFNNSKIANCKYFTYKSIENLIKKIGNKKISFEEFERCYKKVFLEDK